MTMAMILGFCFLLGGAAGLRSLTPPAAVCWAARLGWLHLAGTRFAFLDHPLALIIFSLLAITELVADKLPSTPARTAPIGLSARILCGGGCGLVLAAGSGLVVPFLAGAMGAVCGTFAGYNLRRELVSRAGLPDLAVALAEDVVAIAGSFLVLSRF